LINKEPFGRSDLASVLFISCGTVLVVFFSNHEESTVSLCALLAFYTRTSVIIYLSVMLSVIFFLWFFIKYVRFISSISHHSVKCICFCLGDFLVGIFC
jgi:drug/metabolite transporter (DMT)-like permease